MDTDEDGISIRVRDRHPRRQWHEDVALARHHCAIAIGIKYVLEPPGNIEGHGFFRHALAGNATAIMTAVAGIDYDDG